MKNTMKEVTMMLSPKTLKEFEAIKSGTGLDDNKVMDVFIAMANLWREYNKIWRLKESIMLNEKDETKADKIKKAEEIIKKLEATQYARMLRIREKLTGKEEEGHFFQVIYKNGSEII